MNLSFFNSPGSMTKEKLAKGIFIGLAVLIIFAFFTGGNSSRGGWSMMGNSGTDASVANYVSPMAPQMLGVPGMVPSAVSGKMIAYDGDYANEIARDMYVPAPYQDTAGSPDFPTERKVIRNGSLSLVVREVNKSVNDIAGLASRMGGWVENQNLYEYTSGSLQGNLTLRVPEDKFMETLVQVKLLAVRVQNEQIGSSDVSAQVVDLESRIKNKRAEEASYVAVMKDAKKISDILEVTRMLSSVRGEIEQMEGQINYLARQTSMSTIHIELTPVANAKEVTNEWRPGLVLKESLKNLLVSLTGFANGVIIFVVQVLPVLILQLALLVALFLLVWKAGKKLFYHLGGKVLPPKQG